MADVLLISKPLAPPWTDGAKNLVRHLLAHQTGRHDFRCFIPQGEKTPAGANVAEAIYKDAGKYTPGLIQNARVLARLMAPDRADIYHFFFAPNPRTNRVAKALFHVKRRVVVHTVVSKPMGPVKTWFAQTHVALSEDTASALRAAGAPDVRIIQPGIPAFNNANCRVDRARFGIPQEATTVLFAGDLIEGGGADALADALLKLPQLHGVFACRAKGTGHQEHRKWLQQKLGDQATWLGEVSDMSALLRAVDIQCLPARTLAAKMDLPMVLLEGMQAGLPTVISATSPICELGGEEEGVLQIDPSRLAHLETLLSRLAQDPEWRRKLGHLAQKRVQSCFDAAAMAASYETLYDELCP